MICLQWRLPNATSWNTAELERIPVVRDVKIRIDFRPAGATPNALSLIDRLQEIAVEVGGEVAVPAPPQTGLIDAEGNENVLEVIVSDGVVPFTPEKRITDALENERSRRGSIGHTWVLPVLPAGAKVDVWGDEVRKQNIVRWNKSVDELTLPIFARAGVTSLDRRVFISYRRADSEPTAHQIRQALETLNFDVFLDTVSVDPGINFQDRLFEQLADKSMVVLLHSETFSQSKWTMVEINYAKDHDLSVLIVRFPSVPMGDPLEAYYRAGDLLPLESKDIVNGLAAKPPYSLTDEGVDCLLKQIIEVHDVSMINRLAALRAKTLAALEANSVRFEPSPRGASIAAKSANGAKSYRLFPGSRPPSYSELYEASTCDKNIDDHRIVVGHVSSFHPDRIQQMDWTVNGRNISYADVSMLDSLAREIKSGTIPQKGTI